MDLFNESIVKLPPKLSETALYKLLSLFDATIREDFEVTFERDDEYTTILEVVRYFYKYPERREDGTIDEEAAKIDMEYLAMLILSGKSTRQFTQYLVNGDFNIEGNENMIYADPENPYGIVVNPITFLADDANLAMKEFINLLNHLLYFHSVRILIEEFIQLITIDYTRYTLFQTNNINSIYYESI